MNDIWLPVLMYYYILVILIRRKFLKTISFLQKTIYVYDSRSHEKPVIVREEHEPIIKLAWSRTGLDKSFLSN